MTFLPKNAVYVRFNGITTMFPHKYWETVANTYLCSLNIRLKCVFLVLFEELYFILRETFLKPNKNLFLIRSLTEAKNLASTFNNPFRITFLWVRNMEHKINYSITFSHFNTYSLMRTFFKIILLNFFCTKWTETFPLILLNIHCTVQQ